MVGAPDERGEVGGEGLVGLRTAVERGERVELAAGDDSVAGDRGAVVDGAGAEVDPEEAVGGGEERPGALCYSSRRVAGGVGVSIGFGIGIRIRIGGIGREVEEVEMDLVRVRVRVLFNKVVLDDLVY